MSANVTVIVYDKIKSIKNAVSCVNCYNYSTWQLLAWWLYIKSGLSYRCNRCVGVSCMRVGRVHLIEFVTLMIFIT